MFTMYMLRTFLIAFFGSALVCGPVAILTMYEGKMNLDIFLKEVPIFGLLGGFLAVIISFLNYKRFIKPCYVASKYIENIANSNLREKMDLSEAGYLTQIAEKINETIDVIESENVLIIDSVKKIKETNARNIENLDEMGYSATNATQATEKNDEEIDNISRNLENSNKFMLNLNAQTEQTLASTRDVIESTKEIENSIKNSQKYVNETELSIISLNARFQKMEDILNRFNERTEKISDIVNLISDISQQTNLLALNASIEAARAGEAGKGFSIVALEIKNLAQEVSKATNDIGNTINEIGNDGKEITVLMKKELDGSEDTKNKFIEMKEYLDRVMSKIEINNSKMNEISTATLRVGSEIENASEELNNATESVNKYANDAKKRSDSIFAISKKIINYRESVGELDTVSEALEELMDKYKNEH